MLDSSHMSGWGMGAGWWVMVVFWLGIVIAVFYFIRTGVKSKSEGPAAESALEILKRRYAAGEISKQDYEEKMQDLKEK